MEKKTRVLFLIHTLQVGGAEKVLVDLANNLDKTKFDITVMTVVDSGAFKKKLNPDVKYKTIIKLPRNSKRGDAASGNLLAGRSRLKGVAAKIYQMMWRHKNLKRVYKKYITEEYDVEVAFLEGIAAKIIANSDNKHSKKIAWIHIDLLKERKTEAFFKDSREEKAIYDKFDKIVAVSNTVRDSFIEKFDFDENKVVVEYNPIDSEEIKKKADEERVMKEKFTVCTVGRLSKQKGYMRLLEAVNSLNTDGVDFNLWIIGVGPEERVMRDYIREKNLENVKLLGYKSNPYPYIKGSDLYVCSSITEGFSTTVSEAVILGTPVIATDCSGMREILGDSEYGIVCENSEEGILGAMRDIILDKTMYNKYKGKVLERTKMFDLKRSVENISKILGKR